MRWPFPGLARVEDMRAREYEPDDFEMCMELFETNVPEFFTPAERVEFASFLRALPGPYLVLLDDTGRAVGCGGYAVSEAEGSADLCWGMIRRDLHGRGHGRTLTRLRVDRARRHPGVREIALNTSQHTVLFYEGLGFRTTRVEKDGYGPGLDRHDMVLELR